MGSRGRTRPFYISDEGWYTFQHKFYDDGGFVKVDMSIFDASNALLHTWTLGGTDATATAGGNRYGWVVFNENSSLAIDNAQLSTPAIVPTPKTVWAGLSLFACLIGARGIKRFRRQAELA